MESFQSLAILFILIFICAYVVPFVFNCWRLRVIDFLLGVIYAIYLTPTYVNILPIYAISNIHDITWGSRPEVKVESDNFIEREKTL